MEELKRKCSKCGETTGTKFYGLKTKICAECHNSYTKARGKENKKKVVELLGGKCKACGFDKYLTALDIHHKDPTLKDPNFSSWRGWSEEKLKKEVKSCVLLCRNCHAAVHSKELSLGD